MYIDNNYINLYHTVLKIDWYILQTFGREREGGRIKKEEKIENDRFNSVRYK